MKHFTLYLLLVLATAASAADLTIDGSQTYQIIDGFGVNANHRSWTNNELKPVLDSLIDQAGMTLFRVLYDKADWESTNDNADPNSMNWTYYNSIYSSPDFQKLWDMMAYLNQRGITNGLMLNFQGGGPQWMGGSPLTPGFEDEWAEMVASLFVYARNNRHLNFSLVAPDNEPDITAQGVDMTSSQYVAAMHKLAQLLDANGLSDIRFVGPDRSSTSTAWLSAMMNDSTLASKITHFGFHDYSGGGDISGIYDFLQQSTYPDRRIWVTEFNVWCSACEDGGGGTNSWDYARGTADYLLGDLANGASAAFVWEGYDSQYNYYCPGCWSYWGLFGVDDINASPKTYTPRKQFYTVAQITKFIRPGARRIDVNGSFGPLTVLAFFHDDLGQLTLVGDNTSSSPTVFSGEFTSLPAVPSLDLFHTSASVNLSHDGSVPVTNQTFSFTIPADSIFTLTGAVAPTIPGGLYSGLFYDTNGLSQSSCGSIALAINPHNAFSGSLKLAGKHYPLSGKFDLNRKFSKTIPRQGLSPLTIALQGHYDGSLSGDVSSDSWSAGLLAYPANFNSRTSPAPQAGRYTMAILADSTGPGGESYAALTVLPSGQVRILGSLADGTRFTTSSWVSNDGILLVCLFPYTGKGLLIGYQIFDAANVQTGGFDWIKPPIANAKYYPTGFTNQQVTVGSAYNPPKGQPVLEFTIADLVLSGRSFDQPKTNHIVSAPDNKFTSPDNATLVLNPNTGIFSGNAIDFNQRRVPYSGIILRNQIRGGGYFLDSGQSGLVLLMPE